MVKGAPWLEGSSQAPGGRTEVGQGEGQVQVSLWDSSFLQPIRGRGDGLQGRTSSP